jgi:hypothetical protein
VKTADGRRCPENRLPDARHIEFYERAVALLDFDNEVLNGHQRG